MRILLIEDHEALCTVLHPVLEKAGFGCDVSANGPEGLELLLHNPYDAVVLDRMLPGMDGVELVRAARRAHCTVPVLMLTGPCGGPGGRSGRRRRRLSLQAL